jgi:hypothetical protein
MFYWFDEGNEHKRAYKIFEGKNEKIFMNSRFLAERYSEFLKYVVERQRIWHKRFVLKEPFPWTKDPILQKFHFCNNYRELDKGTVYLINELTPYQNDRRKVLFNVVAYRFFNCYGFLKKLVE